MKDNDFGPHLEELIRALPDVSSEQIEEELRECLEVFKISVKDAKRSILKRHGGDFRGMPGVDRNIVDLVPYETVNLKAKIISVNGRTIERNGVEQEMFYGILADESGSCPFTAWKDFSLEKGQVVAIESASIREWNQEIRINLGEMTGVNKLDEDLTPTFSVSRSSKMYEVNDLKDKMGNVGLKVRVLDVEKRTVNTENGPKEIITGTIGDGSGKVPFTSWIDVDMKVGSSYEIGNAYVRSWRGVPKLNISDNTSVTEMTEDTLPPVEELAKDHTEAIDDIMEKGGAASVAVQGMIVDVRNGSGLVFRCPECSRVLKKDMCMIHKKVEGRPDLRIKAVVDDGTGALTAIFNNALTEKILGKSLDDAMEQVRESMRYEVVHDEIAEKVLATPVVVHGDVTYDEFGPMMIVRQYEPAEVDIKAELETLIDKLGGMT